MNERFAMASTFKALLAGVVLARADAGRERLDREIAYSRADLLSVSPATTAHVDAGAMSVAALCQAAVELSDNTAANLLLANMGGPDGLTRQLRRLGDRVTRLDRNEPSLNAATPGDRRDTTWPAAYSASLARLVLGDALAPASRERLTTWLRNCQTGLTLIRAGLPHSWRVGDKTGRGQQGSTNDVAVIWPSAGPPVVLAVYLTRTTAPVAAREAVVADAARLAAGLIAAS